MLVVFSQLESVLFAYIKVSYLSHSRVIQIFAIKRDDRLNYIIRPYNKILLITHSSTQSVSRPAAKSLIYSLSCTLARTLFLALYIRLRLLHKSIELSIMLLLIIIIIIIITHHRNNPSRR